MSASKHYDKIAWIITALALLLTLLFLNGSALGLEAMAHTMGYEARLFDNTRVHTIDIVMNDWDAFIKDAASEEYYSAAVVIDGEAYKNIAIRGKGGFGGDRPNMGGTSEDFDPTQIPSGTTPSEGFDPSQMPGGGTPPTGFDSSQMPSGFPSFGGTDTTTRPTESGRRPTGGNMGNFNMSGMSAPTNDATGWIWILVSAAILGVGLILAKKLY